MAETKEIRKLDQLQGRASFEPSTYNADDNTIDVVFATETPVLRTLWDGSYYEVLVCDQSSVRMDRMNNGAACLDTHSTWSLSDQIGVVVKAWVDPSTRTCRATIKLSSAEGDKDIVEKIKSGIIRNVSVGYRIYAYEMIEAPENQTPTLRATDWEPYEVSFVPVPADFNSGSRGNTSTPNDVTIILSNTNSQTMNEAEKAAQAAERKRSAEILKACRAANLSDVYAQELIESERSLEDALSAIKGRQDEKPPTETPEEIRKGERARASEIQKAVRATGLDDSFAQSLIDDGTPLGKARQMIIDEAARKQSSTSNPAPQTGMKVGTDEIDKKFRGMESAIYLRTGLLSHDKRSEAGEFAGNSLMDIAKECLRMGNIDFRGKTQSEIAVMALGMKGTRSGGGGLATGDFTFILANVMDKTLRNSFQLAERTFKPWTRGTTANDFKQMMRTQLSEIKLAKVEEGGEYKISSITDSGEVYKVGKFGTIVPISWEAIINDDMGAFTRMPEFMGNAVAQMQSDAVYAILTGSHKMGDTNELFDATNHGNYITPGTDINLTSLGVARAAMRKQKAPGGSPLNLAPKFLIVGPDKEQLALQYTSANFQPTKNSDVNTFQSLSPIVEARITGNQWYLAGNPSALDTIETATVDGQEVYTETRYGWDIDSVQFKVRSVFGAKAIDHRNLVKNAGN